MSTYEAILQYYNYNQTLLPEDFIKSFSALEKARIREPECGQIWSFLARLHANIYSLEIPGFDVADSKKKALQYAMKGEQLNPQNQMAFAILALVRMCSDEIFEARRDIKKSHEMYPPFPQPDRLGRLYKNPSG